ncbi:MAG: hypothetical protein F4X20_09045 [Dehalococcoidia bacterium]|nr:hypothetical protein [Dehalococcoidia bacterium]
MRPTSWILPAIVIFTVFVIFLTGNLYIALLIGLPILFTIGLIILFRRTRPETPPVPLPAGPLLEPAKLEGRIDRMAVEDVEIEGSAEGLFSSGPKYNSILVIIISGIRYRLDPAPLRRGGYDWMKEGMWVKATFDRQSRVIYQIEQAPGPQGYGGP